MAETYDLAIPFEILALTDGRRRADGPVKSRTFEFPQVGAYSVKLEEGVFLPVPELVLAQCSRDLDDVSFLLLAYELLSLHSVGEGGELYARPPLTTVAAGGRQFPTVRTPK